MEKSFFSINQLARHIPKGFVVIDAVKTIKIPLGAVLLRNERTNRYCLYNANNFTSCNQKEAKEYEESLKKADKEFEM